MKVSTKQALLECLAEDASLMPCGYEVATALTPEGPLVGINGDMMALDDAESIALELLREAYRMRRKQGER